MIYRIIHTKSGVSFLISVFTAPIIQFIEKYVFKDWQFIIFLAILIALDTVLGFAKHWKDGTISESGFSKFFTKVLIYACILIVTHTLSSFTISGDVNTIFGWFDTVIYSAIMVREAISILENIAAIKPGIIPAWILKKLKDFDDDGKLNDSNNG